MKTEINSSTGTIDIKIMFKQFNKEQIHFRDLQTLLNSNTSNSDGIWYTTL